MIKGHKNSYTLGLMGTEMGSMRLSMVQHDQNSHQYEFNTYSLEAKY